MTQPVKPLPVTILSGFLGSGKTTLLKHVLSSAHGLRIALVVNDIGEINIDANLIRHAISAPEKKVIELQNGCICCTLRGDLLEELVRLAESFQFDYVIIESSGISEPEQVAETFDPRLAEQIVAVGESGEGLVGMDEATLTTLKTINAAGGLQRYARIDTCVTVIDAFTLLQDFDTEELLSNRRSDTEADDEKPVSQLLVDQIEFADVIIINKIDMVDATTKADVRGLIKKLNHRAKLIEASYGRIDTKEILNTGTFDMDRAQTGSGWLQDLHELTKRLVAGKMVVAPKPETEEYNVENFIYRKSRPFHPERLFALVHDKFILQHPFEEDDDEDEDEDENENKNEDEEVESMRGVDDFTEDVAMDDMSEGEETVAASRKSSATSACSTDDDYNMVEAEEYVLPENDVILKNKRNHPVFSRLFRSKGEFWLATRPDRCGEWSQAGAMLTMSGGRPWFCTLPQEEYMTGVAEIDAMVQHDIKEGGEWGDRRNELVFIGLKLKHDQVAELLDQCLLTDTEWKQWKKIMKNKRLTPEAKQNALDDAFRDGFPDWPVDEHAGHDHAH